MQLCTKVLSAIAATAVAGTALVAQPPAASAQSYNNYNNGYNNGNPGVADVSVASGGVTIIRGDSGAQVAATVNAPVVPGDYMATGPGSVAEVQFDGISMLRLAGNTQARFINLNPGSREVQVASGTVQLAELQSANGSPQIDAPYLSVRPNQAGDYRVSVAPNGETLVTVRSGSATVNSGNGSQTLTPGSTLVAYGNSINFRNAIGFDSFDQFNASRDQATVAAYNANPYISPQLGGYANLANYGQWQNVPGYGYAWAPNNQNQNNFAPYQNGQWVWEPGYGYTWVDNAPYGYTTSHYGSWFNNQNYGGWLWQPPGMQYQNSSGGLASAWLPAAVAFFLSGGNGGGLGSILGNLAGFLGNSNANIGWIPLAPGEQYQPWYGQGYSYPSTSLAPVTNVTNIYNYYGNARYYRGVSEVPLSAWRSGNFRHVIVPQPQQIRQIVIVRGAIPVVPTTANLRYGSGTRLVRPIVLSHTFAVARLAARAAAISHVSFAAQQAKIHTIAVAKPVRVTLAQRRAPVTPTVYHPVAHAPLHLMVVKPVVTPVGHSVVPSRSATTPKPAVHPARNVSPAAHPVTTEKPMAQTHTPAPVVHTAAPVLRQVHTAPPAPHEMHTAPPVHSVRAAPPVVREVHTAPPVMHEMRTTAPVMRPVPQPVVHHAEPAQPEAHRATPVAKPVERSTKPDTHPSTKPPAR